MDDIHFEPFVIESGGQFGEKAQQVLKKSAILDPIYGLMRIKHCILLEVKTPRPSQQLLFPINAQKWFKAHNKSQDPDSLTSDMTDFYEDDTIEIRRMLHSAGPDRVHVTNFF